VAAEPPASRRLDWLACCLWAGLVCVYVCFGSINAPYLSDSPTMLEVSRRIVEHGFGPVPGVPAAESYSHHGLGQSLLNLPVVGSYIALEDARAGRAAGNAMAHVLIIAVYAAAIAALAPVLLCLCCRELGYAAPVALAVGLTAGLGTMQFVYSQALLPTVTLGALWLASLYALLRHAQRPHAGWLVAAGAFAGFAVLTKFIAGLALPVFGLYVLHLAHRRSGAKGWRVSLRAVLLPGLQFSLPALATLGVVLWYNWVRYGVLLDAGYGDGRDGAFSFSTPLLVGLYGLLFSTGKSLFLYNPVLAVSCLCWPRFHRRCPAVSWTVLALAVLMLVAHAKWWAWSGDWGWGPRLLVCLPALLLLPAAEVVPWLTGSDGVSSAGLKVRRAILGALMLASVAVQLPGLAIQPSHFIIYVANEARVFGPGFYHPERWPIRDDGLAQHFIPEFSPLVGHIWMFRCALAPDDRALRQHPPWRSLNPRWVAADSNSSYFTHNLWWLGAWQYGAANRGQLALLAAALAAVGGGLFIVAGRLAVRTPAPDPA
jgi:hypothetical protein